MAVTEFQSTDLVTRSNVNEKIQQINALFPVSVENGGTGATTAPQVLKNLGVVDNSTLGFPDFETNDESSYISQVQAYALAHITDQVPFIFNAGWAGVGYGTAVAWATSDMKFLMLYNMTTGVRFFGYVNGTWSEKLAGKPAMLYSNYAGSASTITLNETVSNFLYIKIYFVSSSNNAMGTSSDFISLNGGAILSLHYPTSDNKNQLMLSAYIHCKNNTITFSRNYGMQIGTSNIVTLNNPMIKIIKVVGYRF